MKNMFLAAILILTATLATPQRSEALIIAAGISRDPGFFKMDFTDSALVNLAICMIVLPICALDEKAEGAQGHSSTAVLLANGYSAEEAQIIDRDQKYLFQTLASKNLSLKVQKADTVESLRNEVEAIAPGISDTYLNFLVQNR